MRIYLETVSMHMHLYSLIYLHNMQSRKFHMQSISKYLSTTTIPNHINYRKREQMLMLFAPKNKIIQSNPKKFISAIAFLTGTQITTVFSIFSSNTGLTLTLTVRPSRVKLYARGVFPYKIQID